MNILSNHITQIKSLCETYNVKSLYAFGSVLNQDFNEKSDIDLIVDFFPLDVLEYGDNYYELKFSLENILNRPIDLLEEKALKNPFFKKTIINQRQLIYG